MSELSIKATRGMLWSLAENLGLQAMQLAISIVLARLLLPEQFGLIGMLALFVALAQSLLDSGFGSALIQKKDAGHIDACSVFYFNLLVGVVLTALLWVAAPLIGSFYAAPILVPLTRVLSLNVIINAFALVPNVLLTKRMDFKGLLKVSLTATLFSGVVGVVMAVQGLGVWSLAAQSVLSTLIRAALLWPISRWRPSPIFSLASLKIMFAFGSRMMLSGLLDTFFNNIYQPLIGKVYSAADVGYYVRAQTLQAAAIQPSGTALGRVMFPALAPIQDDRPRLKQAVQKTLTTVVLFHFPLMVGPAAAADPLIRLLLTDRWAPSILYFQLFCVVGILYPLHVINLTILQATGRSDLFFRLEVVKKLLVAANLAITFRFGITALLCGQVAVSIIAYGLNSHYSAPLIGYSTVQQLRDFAPYLLMSLLMGACMYGAGLAIGPSLPKLMVQVLAGAGIYVGLICVLRRPMLAEVVRLARQAISPAAS